MSSIGNCIFLLDLRDSIAMLEFCWCDPTISSRNGIRLCSTRKGAPPLRYVVQTGDIGGDASSPLQIQIRDAVPPSSPILQDAFSMHFPFSGHCSFSSSLSAASLPFFPVLLEKDIFPENKMPGLGLPNASADPPYPEASTSAFWAGPLHLSKST